VVILGVTIALWADTWAAERREAEVEEARLQALEVDLRHTLQQLQDTRAYADDVAEALRDLVAFTYAEAEQAAVEGALRTGLLSVPELRPELIVYDDLRTSGELALFSNSDLRQALSRMQARIDRVFVYQADLLTVQQLNVDPVLMRRFDLAALMSDLVQPTDASTAEGVALRIAGDREIRNLAMFKLDMVVQLQQRFSEVDSSLVAVENLVEAGLQDTRR